MFETPRGIYNNLVDRVQILESFKQKSLVEFVYGTKHLTVKKIFTILNI